MTKQQADDAYRLAYLKMNEAYMNGVGVEEAVTNWEAAKREWKKHI